MSSRDWRAFSKEETSCDNMDIIKDNYGGNICLSCGAFYGCDHASEYVDFYESRYKMSFPQESPINQESPIEQLDQLPA